MSQSIAFGLQFVLAGGVKSLYDLVLWLWFRAVPLLRDSAEPVEHVPTPAVPVLTDAEEAAT